MSAPGFTVPAPPLFLYQPSSISMYSRPLAAAKSI
jgi:hypothetical protein